MTHVWYLKGLPSYIANLLDKPLKKLEGLVYGDFSFARPSTKKPTFYDYEVYSKRKLHPVTTAFLPFFLPQALQHFEIGKLRQEQVLLENN